MVTAKDGCGFGIINWYPKWMQVFSSPFVFMVFFCFKSIIQGLSYTYLLGVSTSVERHFQLTTKHTATFLIVGEAGPLVTALFFSYYGSKGNKPRWMTFGLLLAAIGCGLLAVNGLIYPLPRNINQEPQDDNVLDTSVHMCTHSVANSTDKVCTVQETSSTLTMSLIVWFMGYSFIGIGSVTIYTIAVPYMDDGVSNKNSPLYFAIVTSIRIVGPLLGYLLSSACLKIYFVPGEDPGVTVDDPRWIGAWWLGLVVMTILLTIVAFFMGMFPKELKKNKHILDHNDVNKDEDGSEKQKIDVNGIEEDKLELEGNEKEKMKVDGNEKMVVNGIEEAKLELEGNAKEKMDVKKPDEGLHHVIVRVIRNPIFTSAALSGVFLVLGMDGYFIWLPKYYEHEFKMSKGDSSFMAGVSGNITMIVGVLLSGFIMTKYRPSGKKVAGFIAVAKYIYAGGMIALLFLHCDTTSDVNGQLNDNNSLELISTCNNECNCNSEVFSPVCYNNVNTSEWKTYFSPCHAGCTQQINTTNHDGSTEIMYTQCTCVPSPDAKLHKGFCADGTCSNLIFYAILLAVIKLVTSCTLIGNIIIQLRCVQPRDKYVALGISFTVNTALGVFPAPMIYSTLIDGLCIVWEESCDVTGACWLYNMTEFRYKFHLLTGGFCIISGIFDIILFLKAGSLKLYGNEDNVIISDGDEIRESKM